MSIFLDTNVLAYQFDDADPMRQSIARETLIQHAADAVISTQVLIELHAVLTRKLGRSRAQAAAVLEALDVDVVPADARLVRRAARTADELQISIFDAMIVEAAATHDCEELWTEDLSEGQLVRGVRVVNPFAKAP